MIPADFKGWKYCSTKGCGMELINLFTEERLHVYAQADHEETKAFVQQYGEEHFRRVMDYFLRVEN